MEPAVVPHCSPGLDNKGRDRSGPIGVFDSGVGGLSVVRQVRQLLPGEDVLFLADQAHVPYGQRPLQAVRGFATAITRFLLGRDAKLVVVACNTASAAALRHLRERFADTPFVGMEPAVKPAVLHTRTGVVGVLATPATFQGALYASVVERFAQGVRVIQQTLPGLVECIEAGDLDGPRTRRIVTAGVRPLIEQGADTLVLACTHYPFVIPLIRAAAGPDVHVIDPSPAIALQAERLLGERRALATPDRAGTLSLLTSGDAGTLCIMTSALIGESAAAGRVTWEPDGEGLRHGD